MPIALDAPMKRTMELDNLKDVSELARDLLRRYSWHGHHTKHSAIQIDTKISDSQIIQPKSATAAAPTVTFHLWIPEKIRMNVALGILLSSPKK
jgi:hypothetical protein